MVLHIHTLKRGVRTLDNRETVSLDYNFVTLQYS